MWLYLEKSAGLLFSSEKDGLYLLHLSLVKPNMTFGLPAWNLSTEKHITKLERVLKRGHSVSSVGSWLKVWAPIYGLDPVPGGSLLVST
jgi:hypothetical protein